MAKPIIFRKSGGNAISWDEVELASFTWDPTTPSDYGIRCPVYDDVANALYFNVTGTFTSARPSLDPTNWEKVASASGSGGHVTEVIKDATTGLITVKFAKGTPGDVTFPSGHFIKKDGSSAVSVRDNLEFKGINLAVANSDADTTQVDFTIGDTKLTNTILATTTNEGAIAELDTEVEAIKKILSQETPAHVENLFTIPAEEANWQDGRFSSLQPANIGSAGAVTRPSVDWVYKGAPITGDPIIGYVYQGATIPPGTGGVDFVYANIGVALSSSRHGELISILDDLVDRDALNTLVPNEDSLFLVNDGGERYTPFADASEGSSDGIKVFRYPQTTPDPHPSIRLFSITFAILFDVGASHYDNQAEVIAQIKNKGLRAFFIHANTDVGSITKLKAAVRLNAANIEDNTDQLAHLPNNEEVFAASDGQILIKEEISETGKVSYMSFTVAVPNAAHANETVGFTFNVEYPAISPLNDIANIKFEVDYVTGETAAQVATKIVAAINAGTNAELVKFRDGQTINGKMYGAYNDIYTADNKVVIASEDIGVIYNATVTGEIDSGDTSVTMSNLTNLGHGTGGIFPKMGFTNLVPDTNSDAGTSADGEGLVNAKVGVDTPIKRLKAGVGIILTSEANNLVINGQSAETIATTAELAIYRGSGYVAGQQFIVTGDAVVAPSLEATPATIAFTFTGQNDFGLKSTPLSGLGSFIETVTVGDPATANVLVGNYSTDVAFQGAILAASTGQELLILPSRVTDTTEGWATSLESLLTNDMTTDAAGTEYSARDGDPAFTVNPKYRRLFTLSRVGSTTTLTTIATGAAQIAPAWTQVGTSSSTIAIANGADEATQPLDQYNLYQVLTPTTIINLTNGTLITVL